MKKKSKAKIAQIYSTALYEAANEKGKIIQVWQDIAKLEDALRLNSDLLTYLSSPLWNDADKKDVLMQTADVLKLNEETRNCLEIVVSNGKAKELPDILGEFTSLYYKKNNIAEVEVETVKNLSEVQDKKLRATLKELLSKEIVVKYVINPAILGGLRVKCGSNMYDDCLATKLNYLENVMKGK